MEDELIKLLVETLKRDRQAPKLDVGAEVVARIVQDYLGSLAGSDDPTARALMLATASTALCWWPLMTSAGSKMWLPQNLHRKDYLEQFAEAYLFYLELIRKDINFSPGQILSRIASNKISQGLQE